MNVFDDRRFVPANEVVAEPGFRHPSPAMFAHLKEMVGEDMANELADTVTFLAVALFDALEDRPISEATAMNVLMAAAAATVDGYTAGVADL